MHSHSRSNQPTALPHSGSNLDPNTLVTSRPLLSSRASSRLASSLTTGFGKGLAGIAGTAGTVVGNVGHLAHKAIGGGQNKEQELLDRAADMVDGGVTTGNSGGDRPGVRASVGGWLRRRKAPFEVSHQRIVVFPGWAVKVPLDDSEPSPSEPNHVQPFDILIHISGFCTTLRPPEQASRTQRMFTRMAKNFADLPSLPVTPRVQPVRGESYLTESNGELTYYRDTESSITDSPAPTDETKDISLSPFFQSSPSSSSSSSKKTSQPDTASVRSVGLSTIESSSARKNSGSSLPNHIVPSPSASLRPRIDTTHSSFSHAHSRFQPSGTSGTLSSSTSSETSSARTPSSALDSLTAHTISQSLMDMHTNLATRLQPFFASVIPNREVVLQVRPRLSTVEEDGMAGNRSNKEEKHERGRPLFEMRVVTSLNGTFMETIRIPWGSLVEDPECLDLIFPERVSDRRRKNSQSSSISDSEKPHEWGLEITARMLSAEGEDIVTGSRPVSPTPPDITTNSASSSSPAFTSREAVPEKNELGLVKVKPPAMGDALKSTIVTPLSMPKGIRIISDLDDTVKHSDIMGGLRNVFRNVFCKDLKDLEVKGMGNLYRKLQAEGGIRGCHFVSNSPFELFEPINSFLNLSQFPAGFSLKLKFYGGRSVFKGLWEPAGERKARGVYEILDGFPKSKFLLFGDSAEQDLDLYASIAFERPHQILAIIIRDVSVLVPASSTMSSARARSNSTLPSQSSNTSSSSSTHTPDGLSLGSSGSSSPTKGTRPRSDTADFFSSGTSSSASSVRGRMSRLTSHVGSVSSSLGPSTSIGTGAFSQAVKDKARSTRSRSSSLIGKGQKTPTMTSSTASTSVEQPEGPDMNLVDSKLALGEQTLSSSSSSSASLSSSSAQPTSQTENAGVYSEDVLDPLYASRPASPQFGASSMTASAPVGASTTLDGVFTDEPQSLDIEEVMSSAMLKQIKQADGFRARFDAARDRLESKGVKVLKFRDVEEIEETLLDLAKQAE
ncbi:Domain of unknown function DUF2183 [Phaffia rhodozyma]|uniref:Phosphatidate phosphatase APP1 catalytic domain-containing protein n=1 Tax=Phaffia rhodozyma TaxID=264483 RepID=A0A0F7SG16_PHARH|nr:Domain of unknown function DUF2183 [Phaffia rhodozyma]